MSKSGDKLAQTRLAIIEHLHRKERRDEEPDPRRAGDAPFNAASGYRQGEHRPGLKGWLGTAQRALATWWRRHPAHTAVEISTPFLSAYARRKPVQFVAIATGIGALVFLARPWKLISLTGLLVAAIKSTQLSSFLMSAVAAVGHRREHAAASVKARR